MKHKVKYNTNFMYYSCTYDIYNYDTKYNVEIFISLQECLKKRRANFLPWRASVPKDWHVGMPS